MQNKPKILSIGEIIWDIYPDARHLGGAPLNFAAHLAACGAASSLLSGVGDDELGHEALARIEAFGVDTEFIEINSRPSGVCKVTLDENSIPSYALATDTAYDAIELCESRVDEIKARGFDAIAFGTIIQRSPALRARLRKLVGELSVGTVFCDLNLRPNCYDADSAGYCLSSATIVKISTEEEPTLRALGLYSAESDAPLDVARAICTTYPNIRELVLTDGANGAYQYDPESDKLSFEPSIRVKVVSTVGAGDSFGAAYLTSRLTGGSVQEALICAVKRSAFVVAHADAIPMEIES